MNVLLINPSQNTKYPQPPMGLALLGAILERVGYEVKIVDTNIVKDYQPYLYSADVVGLTAMTPTITSALDIARSVKKYSNNIKVILGGVHASLLPKETLVSCPEVDTIVVGEGDKAILDVLSNDLTGIYHDSDEVELDGLPFLGYHLLEWGKYKPHPPHGMKMPWLPLLTSRGCPMSCSYCSHGVFGNKYRGQSVLRVVDEIVYLQRRFGVKEIAFYDDVFTLRKGRAYGIADEILKQGIKLSWTCETRVDLVDEELLKIMKRAGCYSISYGLESGSQKILDIINKNITLEQSEKAVAMTKKAGIQTIGYFMIGSPEETPETIRETIEFSKKLKLDYVQFAITTPLPKTMLWEYYIKNNTLNIPWDDLIYAGVGSKTSPVFESGLLDRQSIGDWVSRAYKEFYLRPEYFIQKLGGIRSFGDMRVLVDGVKMLRGM
jgi:anaerobic magnesium-protoporphyrin IX monomethyl ester cyclase